MWPFKKQKKLNLVPYNIRKMTVNVFLKDFDVSYEKVLYGDKNYPIHYGDYVELNIILLSQKLS